LAVLLSSFQGTARNSLQETLHLHVTTQPLHCLQLPACQQQQQQPRVSTHQTQGQLQTVPAQQQQ
jgi:hypothetical protein